MRIITLNTDEAAPIIIQSLNGYKFNQIFRLTLSICTLKAQLEELPEKSVAVTFTVVYPTGNLVLGALSYTILTEFKTSLSVADASN